MSDDVRSTPTAALGVRPRPWTLPRIVELPKLTALTLASAIGGGGGTGGGGSTVFGVLLALLTLGGCTSDRTVTPSEGAMPVAVTAVTCTANTSTKRVVCGGPLNAAPDEIIGGQGVRVILRSRNVDYTGTDFTFEVQVQNVGAQSIGTDGVDPTGVRVFFESDPVVTSGAGTVTNGADSSGTFTAAAQPYYVYHDSLALGDTTAWEPWKFSVSAINTTFTFQVLVSAQVPDHGGILRWAPISSLSRYDYNDIAWSGGNDALAVGYDGHAKKWNGSTWTTVNTGTRTHLYGVAAISPGVYLAVGDSGRVFKVTGKIWTLIHESPSLQILNEVWARDEEHWTAVGEEGTIIEWNAGVPTETLLGGGLSFSMVAGTPSGSLVAVATTNGDLWMSNGVDPWAAFGPLSVGAGGPVLAVALDAEENFYYTYFDVGTFEGYVMRNGFTVSVLPGGVVLELYPFDDDSLIGAAALDLGAPLAAGVRITFGDVDTSTTIVTPLLSDFPYTMTPLNAAGTNFAAICSCANIQVTLGGGAWTEVEDLANGAYVGSWGRGDSVWVAEESGELWKIVNGAATLLNGVEGATGIAGFSGDSLFIIADSMLYVGDGTGPWVEATRLVDLGPDAFFNSIWGDTASHTLIVTGENGRVMERVGGVWSELAPAGMNVSGVWGCSATEAWIMSVNGAILNWTPGALTPDPAYLGAQPLQAVTGTGCADVWAGGPNSALYRWAGTTWDGVTISGDQIFIEALFPRAVGGVYVGGEDGKVASVNAAGLTSRMLVNSQSDGILTLWGFANGDLLAGGSYTITLGRR